MPAGRLRLVGLLGLLGSVAVAQRWQDIQGRSSSGIVALRQALLDARSDALALLVAAHPDDRYVLPAVQLRYRLGVRVAVLLASRGGGGQNSVGPETGDALERIRTLEAEAGCWRFDGKVYYLNRPDRGFRRTAAETFDEWGRAATLRELVRLLRIIEPDLVITTHHAEEDHGHDLALAELLPEAVTAAADAAVDVGVPPHRASGLFLGATSTSVPGGVTLHADEFEPNRGAGLRRLAHDILLECHLSPGAPPPMDTVFNAEMAFVPAALPWPPPPDWTAGGGSLFDAGIWPGDADLAARLRAQIDGLAGAAADPPRLIDAAVDALRQLLRLECAQGSEAGRRRDRRVEALQRVVLHASAIKVEVEPKPGAVAVPGEEIDCDVRVYVGGPRRVDGVRVTSAAGDIALETADPGTTSIAAGSSLHGVIGYRVPLARGRTGDLMEASFRADQFIPPVRLRFLVETSGVVLPVVVDLPVELRPPVGLAVEPRMLLCPTGRDEVKFSVEAVRNSAFPVVGDLDVRAPAGYQLNGDRRRVELRDVNGDTFDFSVRPAIGRKSGVDVIRIALGEAKVLLPLHKIDVQIDPRLRIGVVRSCDDALLSVIGVGGFGLSWSELTDVDLAVSDLREFDTIAIDVRALRDRPAARRSFRRLLDFCGGRGKRLVVFYHKDTEFEPPGEKFVGAPLLPFQIGHERVTRADAPVTVLQPGHCLLNRPNRILPGDWDEWEQERALYLPSDYASEYQEILAMGDPGQPARRSALLYARVGAGQGEYVYCALALWRQLKKLHPGSVRLLANLLTPQPPAQ